VYLSEPICESPGKVHYGIGSSTQQRIPKSRATQIPRTDVVASISTWDKLRRESSNMGNRLLSEIDNWKFMCGTVVNLEEEYGRSHNILDTIVSAMLLASMLL